MNIRRPWSIDKNSSRPQKNACSQNLFVININIYVFSDELLYWCFCFVLILYRLWFVGYFYFSTLLLIVFYFELLILGLRNAFQGEMVGEGEDKEVILITLRRPLIYIQPVAVDKAILVWLNYKNAYEYWNEQRAILNKEVLTATEQVKRIIQCFFWGRRGSFICF